MRKENKKSHRKRAEKLFSKAVLGWWARVKPQTFMGSAAGQQWILHNCLTFKRTCRTSSNIPRICYTIRSTASKNPHGWLGLLSFFKNRVPRWIEDYVLRFLPGLAPQLHVVLVGVVREPILWARVWPVAQPHWLNQGYWISMKRVRQRKSLQTHTPERPQKNHCILFFFPPKSWDHSDSFTLFHNSCTHPPHHHPQLIHTHTGQCVLVFLPKPLSEFWVKCQS